MKSSCFDRVSCSFSVSAVTRMPIDVSSWRRFVTGFHTRMSPFSPCVSWPVSALVSVTQSS